jgi:hypothetical protein
LAWIETPGKDGMKTTLPESAGVSPYVEAQVEDLRENARAWSMVDASRRIIASLVILLGLSGAGNVIQATRPHDVEVYGDAGKDGLRLMGSAQATRTPSELNIEHQLVLWLSDMRDVPGNDWDLVDRNVHDAFAMTASASPAFSAENAYLAAHNPKEAGKRFTRTIVRAEASRIQGTWDYAIVAVEKIERNAQTTVSPYTGTVQIAPDPQIPADERLGAIDPAGVFVVRYDLHWSDPE